MDALIIMPRKQITFLCALAVLVALAGFFGARPTAPHGTTAPDKDKAAVGLISTSPQPIPDHRLIGLDGQARPADELHRGRVLFVYLTTGCEPCIKEVEVISRLQRDATPALRIYGIGMERPAQLNTFIEKFDPKFPIFVDENARLAKSLDIHHFPSKYYAEDGVITKIWRGRTKDEAALRHELSIE